MQTFSGAAELAAATGNELGVSDWLQITQQRVDLFAQATGDWQWVHTDPGRAAAGPFGGTVAHGYLTISLLPHLSSQVYALAEGVTRINYGLDRVRFPAPVRVGARIRDRVRLIEATQTDKGQRILVGHTVEIEGSGRPACLAETISLVVWS